MTRADAKGTGQSRTPAGDQLRDALRQALDRFIDPDDDTMAEINRVDGGFAWVPAEAVLDDLVAAISEERP